MWRLRNIKVYLELEESENDLTVNDNESAFPVNEEDEEGIKKGDNSRIPC